MVLEQQQEQAASADQSGSIPMSERLSESLQRSYLYASEQSHRHVLLEHLLLALTEDPDASSVLIASNVKIDDIRNDLARFLGQHNDRFVPSEPVNPTQSDDVRKVLEYASAAAKQSHRNQIDGGIVLAALIGEGQSASAELLRSHGLTFEEAILTLREQLGIGVSDTEQNAGNAPTPFGLPESASGNTIATPEFEQPPIVAAPAQIQSNDDDVPNLSLGTEQTDTIRNRHAAPPPTHDNARLAQGRESYPPRPAPLPEPPAKATPSLNEGLDAARSSIGEATQFDEPIEEQSESPRNPASEADYRPPGPEPRAPQPYNEPAPLPRGGTGTARTVAPQPYNEPAPRPGGPMPQAAPPHFQPGRPPAPPRPPGQFHGQPPPQYGQPQPYPAPMDRPPMPAPYPAPPGARPPMQRPPGPGNNAPDMAEPQAPGLSDLSGRKQADTAREQNPAVEVTDGVLVENIPRTMRVARPETIEVRIARSQIPAMMEAMHGRGAVISHELKATRAMSIRLRAPEGGFWIESSSPETQWIENTLGLLHDDFASWRYTITPNRRGKSKLQLVVSARTVGADGMTAETALPDQVIDVSVRINYRHAAKRLGGWAAAAAIGGMLGAGGETILRAITRFL